MTTTYVFMNNSWANELWARAS